MLGGKTRGFTWSPVRWHLRTDGIVPHDHVLIVDSWVGLLVYHLRIQSQCHHRPAPLAPFPSGFGLNSVSGNVLKYTSSHLVTATRVRILLDEVTSGGFL